MTHVDAALLLGWLTARSVAREVTEPIDDHGGWRVDTGSISEVSRYVFPMPTPGLSALGETVTIPRVFLKLCADGAALSALLPDRWRIVSECHVMTGRPSGPAAAPPGYRIERDVARDRSHVRIVDHAGTIAASGYSALANGVFAYDRIVTDPAHRRRGLGRVVMAALADGAPAKATHMLVATDMGRSLYRSLGWNVLAPYATAVIPG